MSFTLNFDSTTFPFEVDVKDVKSSLDELAKIEAVEGSIHALRGELDPWVTLSLDASLRILWPCDECQDEKSLPIRLKADSVLYENKQNMATQTDDYELSETELDQYFAEIDNTFDLSIFARDLLAEVLPSRYFCSETCRKDSEKPVRIGDVDESPFAALKNMFDGDDEPT